MLFRSLTIVVALAATFTFSYAQPNSAALTNVVNQMTAAQTRYDAAALRDLVTSDYVEVSPLGEVDPLDKFLSFYSPEAKAAAGNVKAAVEASELDIREYGKFAIVIARLTYSVSAEGRTLPPRSIRATYVMRKEKGKWRVASAQYTGIRPAAPPK